MRTFAQKQNQPQKPVSSSLARSNMATPEPDHREHPILHSQTEEPDGGLIATASPRFGHDFSRIPIHSPALRAIQLRLAINQPGDVLEQEADRIADRAMATPPYTAVSGTPPYIQRFSGQSNGQMDAAPASVDRALASPGRPLEPVLRQDMEQRFGHDFSQVRVHSDPTAEQSAREVNAHAYTVGHNIVFGAGRFAPETQVGRRLIAHELTHVVQQRQGKPLVQRAPPRDPDPKWVSPSSGEIQPAKPVYNTAVNPNNLDWRGQNHTLQEPLDKAFEQVCYDDNGNSTGITMDQLHESAWVKTSYGKTVPVEWKGPHGAEVSIDVAHNPPAPDIAHVGWQRPGKSKSGHIFLDDTPYGRAPLTIPQAKFPTPRTTPPAGGSVDADQVEGVEGKVAVTEQARAIAGADAQLRRAQALGKRLARYYRAWQLLQQGLAVLDAITTAEDLIAHGTALPKEQAEADGVLKESDQAVAEVDATVAQISWLYWIGRISDAQKAQNRTALDQIISELNEIKLPMEQSARNLQGIADDLTQSSKRMREESQRQWKIAVRPQGESTLPNAVAAALWDATTRLSGTIAGAAENYAAAAETLRNGAEALNELEDAADDAAKLIVFERIKQAQYKIDLEERSKKH
jgi:hypothetical protein